MIETIFWSWNACVWVHDAAAVTMTMACDNIAAVHVYCKMACPAGGGLMDPLLFVRLVHGQLLHVLLRGDSPACMRSAIALHATRGAHSQ
jgi:hypothetical protein